MTGSLGTVLVTGASGFVGRHVVHALHLGGYSVRALVRRVPPPGLDGLAEVHIGDLTRPDSYAAALSGVTTVVHCALTDSLGADVEATVALERHSAEAGSQKFIHLSSIAVYGNPPHGTITEATAPIPSADVYPRTKLAIEVALQAEATTPELVMLRLGCVYGPGGGWWTEGLLGLMDRGRMILVDDGAGMANLVHVEDVSRIIPLVIARSGPPRDIFNVTDGTPVTWKVYFAELETIVGRRATVSMSAGDARAYGRAWSRPSLARRAIRKLFGRRRIHPLDDSSINTYASRAVYSGKKASEQLGFAAAFDLQRGMRTVRGES